MISKYTVQFTREFKKDYKKIVKQGKNIDKLKYVINELANGRQLDPMFRNHQLVNSKYYSNSFECHIEPDWLLVYKYNDDNLILLLIATGSHSKLF